MGCFFACFCGNRACKHRKRRHLVNAVATQPDSPRDVVSEALQLVESTKQEAPEKPIAESKDEVEEALNCCSTIKTVTSDLNVKTLEEELAIEQVIIDNLVKNNENEESVDLVKSNENDKEIDNSEQENENKESGDDDLVKKIELKKGSENIGEAPKVPTYRYQIVLLVKMIVMKIWN